MKSKVVEGEMEVVECPRTNGADKSVTKFLCRARIK